MSTPSVQLPALPRGTPPCQTRSTLTTLHWSYSLGTHKTKPGGQAGSERNSATVCELTGMQRSTSTGISAGQAPTHDRSSSIVVGLYRMSSSKARKAAKRKLSFDRPLLDALTQIKEEQRTDSW